MMHRVISIRYYYVYIAFKRIASDSNFRIKVVESSSFGLPFSSFISPC